VVERGSAGFLYVAVWTGRCSLGQAAWWGDCSGAGESTAAAAAAAAASLTAGPQIACLKRQCCMPATGALGITRAGNNNEVCTPVELTHSLGSVQDSRLHHHPCHSHVCHIR
jgi:hypothetical protein